MSSSWPQTHEKQIDFHLILYLGGFIERQKVEDAAGIVSSSY